MNEIKETVLNFIDDYMEYSEKFFDAKITNPVPEEKLSKVNNMKIPETGRNLQDVVNELNEDVLPYGNQCSHHRFFGFIPAPASQISWVGDVLTGAYNRHAGSAANQPAVWCIEQKLIAWLNEQVGFPKEAGGTFVSGGSMANLTALTIARDHFLNEDGIGKGVAYMSCQTHSSVGKALRVIGVGDKRIRLIPTDNEFKMNVHVLKKTIIEDIEKGLKPFLVIATAGTTNTGSVDSFREIREICNEHHLWLHVDGAFGASVILSKKHKHELAGIETADSISWDAHKWLFQTFGCGILLVRDQNIMLKSFSVHPEYLKDLEKDGALINPWDLGIELTRPTRCLKLWLTLQVMGSDKIADHIDYGIECAEWVEKKITENPEIEIVSPAKFAVVNFRYNPSRLSENEKDILNSKISQKILENGYAGVFTTELGNKKVLRMYILHPDVTKDELAKTLDLLDQFYREFMKKV